MCQKVWVEASSLAARATVQALSASFACEIFPDGISAVERLARGDAPDALITGWQVPGFSGAELCRFIRNTRDELNLPILLVASRKGPADLLEALAAGANDYLAEPYDGTELVARVRKLCRTKQLHESAIEIARAKAELARTQTDHSISETGHLATTLRSVGDAIVATDAQGHISFMNPVAEALTGWTQAEAQARPLRDIFRIINEFTRAELPSPIAEILRRGTAAALANHTLLIRRDGIEVPIADSAAPIFSPQGQLTGVVLVFRDVRAQRDADHALRKAHHRAEAEKQKFESLFAQSLVAIAVLEGPGYTFTFANPAYRAIGGGVDVVGKPLLDAQPELRGQGFEALLDKVLATGVPFMGHEVPVKLAHHGDNEFLYVNLSYQPRRDAGGRVDGILVSAVNVTEQVLARQRAEEAAQALHRSEERLRRVVEASGAGLWDLEVATGKVDADRRLVTLMGLPEGSTFTLASGLDSLLAEDRARVEAAVAAALVGDNNGRYLVEFRTGGKGTVPLRWVESRANVQFDEDGKALRLAGSTVDITARKLAAQGRDELLMALAAQPLVRVCVLEGPELICKMANAVYLQQVARGRDLLGKPLLSVIPEANHQPFVKRLQEVIETGVPYIVREELALVDRGDGVLEKSYFSAVYQPMRGDTELFDSVLIIATDITDSVNARQAIEGSRAHLQEIFQQAPAAIALLEGRDHRFALANPLYRQLVGGRDVAGKTVAEALPEVVDQGFIGLLDEVRRSGTPYLGKETWIKLHRLADAAAEDVCLNFVYQPLRAMDGQVDSIFVHAVEVTALVHARETAQRLAAERQSAYDVLEHGDPTFILDANWCFTFANAAWIKWTGNQREDVLGRNLWSTFPASREPDSKYIEAYHRAMRERVPVHVVEYYPPKNVWASVNLYPTADGGIASFVRDVSREKLAEAEIQSRVEFERQLIGIVSHDLRNPLANILMGSELLMLREDLDASALRTLIRIQTAGERATRMVRDLLDFTQVRAGGGIPVNLSVGNLHSVVRQAVEDAGATHPEREIRVTTTGDGHGVWDLDRLSQVTSNLISNALKYSAPGSPVDVRCASDDMGITTDVHNIGPPINAEAQARIFLPMQRATSQLENSARSVGLGLFIVKHLVEAHGGHIAVTSTTEAGTTFTFWVPKHRAAA